MKLSAFLETVYAPLRLRGRSPNSIRLLRHAVRQFSRHLGRDAELIDLEDLAVCQFLAARGATLSPYSVERERCGLLALWRLAADRRLVECRPCVRASALPDRTPRAFTMPELDRLLAAAAAEPGYIGPFPAGRWFSALILTLYESGERVAAVLGTPLECWQSPYLRVPAIVRKGRRRERLYELSPTTAAEVSMVAASSTTGMVFGWPYAPGTIYGRYGRITARAGFGSGREFKFHALRRTTASHLAAAGVDATAYLGHSSDRITRRSYLDPRITGASGCKPIDALPRPRPRSA
jgi:integrase